ncbi:MAG: hypothetical protein PUD93_11015 [Lachnospiraceae bacterium]|nr:hypothetical protein [Lachnospiraceae bacterium]
MKKAEQSKITVRIGVVILAMTALYILAYRRIEITSSDKIVTGKEKPCVVIDAGHGGGKLRLLSYLFSLNTMIKRSTILGKYERGYLL